MGVVVLRGQSLSRVPWAATADTMLTTGTEWGSFWITLCIIYVNHGF
jgi:hypothetical protein